MLRKVLGLEDLRHLRSADDSLSRHSSLEARMNVPDSMREGQYLMEDIRDRNGQLGQMSGGLYATAGEVGIIGVAIA